MLQKQCAMLFLGLSLLVLEASAKAESFIQPCRVTNDNDCYLASAKKALPFIAQKVDPLELDDVNADAGDLRLQFTNLVLHRFKECEVLELLRSERLKAFLKLQCPVKIDGKYTIEGKFFTTTVDGAGPVQIHTDKIQLNIHIILKTWEGKDNLEYYKITKYEYDYLPIARPYFNFENLFGGDQAKAEPVMALLNDETIAKELLLSAGKPVVAECVKKVISGPINDFFKHNAAKDIELA